LVFGARMLKTGMAVTLSLYISVLLEFTPPVIAAVAAIFAMQPSIYRSWRYFLDQLQTNTMGAALAMAGGALLSNEPFAIGLVCIVVIMICMKLKMEETVGLTLVTVISVMEASGDWGFALNRFVLSIIGIVSAFLINIIFFPPNPRKQFVKQIESVFARMSLLLRTVISNEMKEKVFRDEKEALENALKSLGDKFKLLEEELKKLKRGKLGHTRQLVVYRQMLLTLGKGMEVLDAAERHYFQAKRPLGTDQLFDQHLEHLIKFHERILLKYENKLKPDPDEAKRVEESNERFMQQSRSVEAASDKSHSRLIIVAAAMYDYGYQMLRLDKLIERYRKTADKPKANGGLFAGRLQ